MRYSAIYFAKLCGKKHPINIGMAFLGDRELGVSKKTANINLALSIMLKI